MDRSDLPYILMIGNDPAIAYLLERYAQQSGRGIRAIRDSVSGIESNSLNPQVIYFLSLDALDAFQPYRAQFADIPVAVCSSIADELRANELGADYFFLHPITYDYFLSTLEGGKKPSR